MELLPINHKFCLSYLRFFNSSMHGYKRQQKVVKSGNFSTDENIMRMRYYKLHSKFIILYLHWDGLAVNCTCTSCCYVSTSKNSLALRRLLIRKLWKIAILSIIIIAISVSQNDSSSCYLGEESGLCILKILSH